MGASNPSRSSAIHIVTCVLRRGWRELGTVYVARIRNAICELPKTPQCINQRAACEMSTSTSLLRPRQHRIKDFVKKVLRRWVPGLLFAVRAAKMRRFFKYKFLQHQKDTKSQLFGKSDPYILSGPFAGLRYLNETVWGSIEPKWLGTYERELHSIVDEIVRTGYETVIDVGSAEGYYSVGLGRKLPFAAIYSYDIDPWARAQQRRLARMNGVQNLRVRKYCNAAELEVAHCRPHLGNLRHRGRRVRATEAGRQPITNAMRYISRNPS